MDDGVEPVEHEEGERRGAFYLARDGKRVAELTYSRVNDRMVIIDHTEVDPTLGGRGIGRRLLDAAVGWARATGTVRARSVDSGRPRLIGRSLA
jgi:predicted GNAT family acetyltransferase